QRMHDAIFDRRGGGRQRLAEHLAAEHLRAADVAALAPEEIHLEGLELQQLQQIRQLCVHCWIGSKSPAALWAASPVTRFASRPRDRPWAALRLAFGLIGSIRDPQPLMHDRARGGVLQELPLL